MTKQQWTTITCGLLLTAIACQAHDEAEVEKALAEVRHVHEAQYGDTSSVVGELATSAERAAVQYRMRLHVLDGKGSPVVQNVLDLGVFSQIQTKMDHVRIVTGGDNVTDIARARHQNDRYPIDLDYLGNLGDDFLQYFLEIQR